MTRIRVHVGLGEALRNRRIAKDMTQAELADAAGLHRNVVGRLEAGGGHITSLVAAAAAVGGVVGGRSLSSGDHLGSRVLDLRKRRRLSRKDVAALAGVSTPAIESVERTSLGHVCVLEDIGRAIAAGLELAEASCTGFWSGAASRSASEEWYTPAWLLDRVSRAVGDFDMDPCSPGKGKSAVQAAVHLTAGDDGLDHQWIGNVWLNPPYGPTMSAWLAKARHEVAVGNARLVLGLVPARTDTRWWHDHVVAHTDIVMLKGRLTFLGATAAAPFPSALVGYGLTEKQRSDLFQAFPDSWTIPQADQGAFRSIMETCTEPSDGNRSDVVLSMTYPPHQPKIQL